MRALVFALSLATAGAATRFEEFTARNAMPRQPVKVRHAGLLGGAGTEWLASGGFQPDGTVVLAGTALGPVLDLGLRESVLGPDGPIAAPLQPVRRDKKGNPELNKEGAPRLDPFAWNHEQSTGFVVRLSPDLRTLKSVTRLAWKSGGLTSAVVDAAGNIFIAGPASETIEQIGGDVRELAAPAGTSRSGCTRSYVARLTPEASRVVWVRHVRGASDAPALTLDAQGRLHFSGPDFRVLDADGQQLSAQAIPGEAGGFVTRNPVDGTIVRGGEHHWSTGREPWRCPTLDVFRPDGALRYQFYDWGGPFVGLNNLRLVSDTAVRGVAFDPKGNLLFHAWSDGGNSVALREPMDIRAMARMDGLGFSAWGAGVLSVAYVVKLDPQTWRVIGGTPWMAYQTSVNKPNSARITALAGAADGSICFAGNATHGLIQTGDAIGGGEPGGEYVAILSADASSLRFCTALPACGQAVVNDSSADGARWGIVAGKNAVLFLGSAAEKNTGYDTNPPPAVNARQAKFGGGATDGFALLLDLAP